MKHYAQQGGRLSPGSRVHALEAGLWQASDNSFIRLRQMPDGHVVNALLQHIERGYGDLGGYTFAQWQTVMKLLTREVRARGIEDMAMAEAEKRDRRYR
jgi:hypothetical protein